MHQKVENHDIATLLHIGTLALENTKNYS